METVTIAKYGDLFCIPCGEGYSCLGFDVAIVRARAIAAELQRPDLLPAATRGTLESYAEYTAAVDAARTSGRRLTCELVPQLVGLEGRRVEVVDCYGERRRFKVGKSTGFLPCHLELANCRSSGGPVTMGAPYRTVRIVA